MKLDPGNGAVTVKDTYRSRYGPKAVLGGQTYEAKEAIKELEWDETHRRWNDEIEAWEVDYEALDDLEAKLEEHGFTLGGLASDVIDVLDDVPRPSSGMWENLEIRISVEYESKQSDRILEKSGVIYGVDNSENKVMFKRDDGTVMRISGNSLYTSYSQYPFVGNIVSLEIDLENADLPDDEDPYEEVWEDELRSELEQKVEAAVEIHEMDGVDVTFDEALESVDVDPDAVRESVENGELNVEAEIPR